MVYAVLMRDAEAYNKFGFTSKGAKVYNKYGIELEC